LRALPARRLEEALDPGHHLGFAHAGGGRGGTFAASLLARVTHILHPSKS
jgi:hypothetical protein